ncbi:MAG: HD domain-containing protein, partial [Candidatus Eremiobacteraeota bacterium]|nr:HD domain-containing protein [Candidatus Eremiobacteraeota bacterium]
MQRTEFLDSLCAIAAAVPLGVSAPAPPLHVAGIAIPDTALARDAGALAAGAEKVEIYNHSLRTFFFAELLAKAMGIAHDPEVVYVAAILHDLGLTSRYMSDGNRFEVDGANAARALLEKHGVASERVDLAWDAIALHDSGGIARFKQPEVRLVNAGVAADFGANLDRLG